MIERDLAFLAARRRTTLDLVSGVPWGDSRSHFHITFGDGCVVAARRLTGPDASTRASVLVRRFDHLMAAGILVPHPAEAHVHAGMSAWVLTPWVEGVVGGGLLGDPTLGPILADEMGRLSVRTSLVPTIPLGLDRAWSSPAELAGAARGWSHALGSETGSGIRRGVDDALETVLRDWGPTSPWQIGMAHGDFVPINVIRADDGRLYLLDLDDLRLAPHLYDLAWWDWVVRYHHPDAWRSCQARLLEAAGIESHPAIHETMAAMARLQLVERVATASDAAGRARWLRRLRSTLGR